MINLLSPPMFDDEDKTLTAHHLFVILRTFMAVGWLPIFIAVIIPGTVYRWLLVVGVTELAGLILLVLNKYGHTRLVSNLLIFIIWAVATGMALTGGGTRSNAMAIYFIVVLIAGLVQSGKAVIITALLCSLTGLFLVQLEYSGALPVNQVPHTPLTLWMSMTIYMVVIISLQYLVSRTIKRALKQSRQELKERQRIDTALLESEELYTKLIATMPDIIVRMNLKGEILFINDVGLRLSGYQGTELIGQNMFSFVAPEDRDKVARNAVRMLERKLGPQEYHLIMKDGIKLLFEINGDVLRHEDGSPYGMVQICRDITKRKRAEDALRRSEERYRTILESIDDGYFEQDLAGNFIFLNDSMCRIYGYTKEKLIGMNYKQYTDKESGRKCLQAYKYIYRTGEPGKVVDFEIIRKDGTKRHIESSVSLQKDSAGKPIAFRGIVRDVTERKLIEDVLRQSEEKYRNILESIQEGYFELDLAGNYIFANEANCRFLGYTKEELVGMNYRQHTGEANAKKLYQPYLELYQTGIPIETLAVESIRKDGTKMTFDTSVSLIRDSEGKSIGFRAISRDITERKQAEDVRRSLEERLNRAEKMEALGQLAGGVAHDLNNVLGILSGYSELLLLEIPEGQRVREHAEKILQSTQRGATIIQDLLTLARRGVTVSEVINLNDVISIFLTTPVFENIKDYHPRVTFRTECGKNLLNIKGSPVHLEKTLMNLVLNAAESIPGKGEVTIRTKSLYLDKAVRGYDEVKEGDYAVLTISDTGKGISAENREKIFEPFYTKKAMGRSGTGLGLAIVWGTVKDHHGYIDVQSDVGEGTIFTLYFPVTREELVAPRQKEPIERYMGKGESILVVDDTAEQRDVASGLLARLGYEVRVVASGEDAVEYLKANKADILVLDMIMAPGIDGLSTYQRVLEVNPKQKAILVSGFSETDRVKEAQKLGAGAYVKKPYVMETIGVAIRDELSRL